MSAPLRLPARFLPIYAEAKELARIEREEFPDPRTVARAQLAAQRAERDRAAKMTRTMLIAAQRTAQRAAELRYGEVRRVVQLKPRAHRRTRLELPGGPGAVLPFPTQTEPEDTP